MSERMKKLPIKAHANGEILHIIYHNKFYEIPKYVADKFVVKPKKLKKFDTKNSSLTVLFKQLDETFTKAGALLQGLRLREGLSQVMFAKEIQISQTNLSSMENGRRPIGKILAKRIEKRFGTNYRYFLE